MYQPRRFVGALMALLLTMMTSPTWSQQSENVDCRDDSFVEDFETRAFPAPSARTPQALRVLMDRPVQLAASAEWIDHPEARIETITDYHAVYPGTAEEILTVTQDNDRVVNYIPNLVLNDVLCTAADGTTRIQQRSEINVLFLSIVSDFILDVRNEWLSDDRGFTKWTFYRSINSDLVYSYGSFYAENVRVDGVPHVYVRHYARTGISSGIVGARAIIWANLDGQIRSWLRAVSEEHERRFGAASSR